MVTQTLQSGQRSHHLLFNYERDNFTAVDQMEDGNFGDHHDLPKSGGLWELRIHYGKGFRVYYGYHKGSIIVVVCGGEKDTQDSDVKKATKYWAAFKGSIQ